MPTTPPLSGCQLVQTMVDPETHRVLCQHAACDGVTLEQLAANVLTKYVKRGLNRLADAVKEKP